jgi:signal transduction histidine kinase
VEPRRVVAAGSVSLTGLLVTAVVASHLPTATAAGGLVGTAVAAVGLLMGVAFAAGGVLLARSGLRTAHVVRVAGWNLLGAVATSVVLVLVGRYQLAVGGRVRDPLFGAVLVVGVSATAHVLIGLNDVRRIRARRLAEQYRKSAVVNRFVRHDLRHTGQLLMGWGDLLETGLPPERSADLGSTVRETGAALGEVSDQVRTVARLVEEDAEPTAVDLDAMLDEVVAAADDPGVTVTVNAAGGDDADRRVAAGPALRTALSEVLENAVEHAADAASVTVADGPGRTVAVRVADDGPGIPDDQRALINEDREETQLDHGDGLGLWLAKWIVEAYGGTLRLPDAGPDDDHDPAGTGGRVELRLDAA